MCCNHLPPGGHCSPAPPPTTYAQDGCSHTRLEAILKKRSCCSQGCFELFTLPELSKVCRLWHALSPEQQTQYLSSQYKSLDLEPGPDGLVQHPKRTDWFLCGIQVCVQCFCCLLGVGRCSIYKKLRQTLDMRKTQDGAAHRTVGVVVDMFFWSCTIQLVRICLRTRRILEVMPRLRQGK